MEQMEHFGLASIMYMCTVFLVHMHSGVYGDTKCITTRCTLEVFFETKGDTPCNEAVSGTTEACEIFAPRMYWRQPKNPRSEFVILLVDAGPGGPWYCPPNVVLNYQWVTSVWFVRSRGMPEATVTYSVKPFQSLGNNDYMANDAEHTFYVLLYHVHTFKRTTLVSTVLNATVRAEIRRRAEAKANLSYTLEPFNLKHPDDLLASYHFRYISGYSCHYDPPKTTVTSTTVPNTTRSASGAGYNNVAVNAGVISCVCVMANMLLLCQ